MEKKDKSWFPGLAQEGFGFKTSLALFWWLKTFLKAFRGDAGVGWIIEGEELMDGRLQVRRLVHNPNVDCVNGFVLPAGFPQCPEFEEFSNAISSIGGHWETVAEGLFSTYVPKGSAQKESSLERDLCRVLENWGKRRHNPPGC